MDAKLSKKNCCQLNCSIEKYIIILSFKNSLKELIQTQLDMDLLYIILMYYFLEVKKKRWLWY